MNPRAIAARIIDQVCQGRSLSQALDEIPSVASAQRPLIQEIGYGTLRDYPRLSRLAEGLLKKPLKTKDGDLHALLLVGLYQLTAMRVPVHAAVSETVAATTALKKPWARGLVNGVLRNFLRHREQCLASLETDETAHWAHPRWLIDAIREAWPGQWQAILAANNRRPPMCLRVNTARIDVDEYLARLVAADCPARRRGFAPAAVELERPVDVSELPGFARGQVSVQDEAAQLAAGLLQLAPGQRVLDVCAAPGGKTGHILETAEVELVAVDVAPVRLEKVAENLTRLGQRAQLIAGDATRPAAWWDGRLFDRILLDVPCSATGVIRRHPDIKLLRRPADIQTLLTLQTHILDATWPLLRPGGILLYATCSVLPQENAQQVMAFVARQTDAQALTIDAGWGHAVEIGRQILPGDNVGANEAGGMDGFYYACLTKQLYS
jgi:16S rRNA (cytosine967-C5)-methyltransferase